MSDQKNKNWFPKWLTVTLLSVILSIEVGIFINIITSEWPDRTLLFFLVSAVLFLISSAATFFVFRIRMSIDDLLSTKKKGNQQAKPKNRNSPDELWCLTLRDISIKKMRFRLCIWGGIASLVLGLLSMIWVNYNIRSDNISNEKRRDKLSLAVVDSLNHLNQKLEQQNILILQLTDSVQSMNKSMQSINKEIKEIRVYKDVNDKKEKNTNR